MEFIEFIMVWLIIYLLYFLLIINRKNKLKRFKDNSYVKYLKNVYKVDINKIGLKTMTNIVALTNGFIISFTILMISIINNIYLKMFAALIILIVLQLLIYHIIGKKLGRKNN